MKYWSVLASCLVVLWSCGDSSTKNDSPTTSKKVSSPFLEFSQFDPPSATNAKILTSSQVLAKIHGNSDLMDDTPDDDSDECSDEILGATLSAEDDKLTYGVDLDLSACFEKVFAKDLTDFDLVALKVLFKFYFEIQCDGADLSSYDGQSFKDVSEAEDDIVGCEDATTGSTLSHTQSTFEMTIKSQKEPFVEIERKTLTLSIDSGPKGKACLSTRSGDLSTGEDGCLSISKDTFQSSKVDGEADDDEGKVHYSKIVKNALVSAKGDNRWYTGGAMKVTFDNWTGDVTYTDATTAPTFTITDGTETENGSVLEKAPAQFALQRINQLRQRLKDQIRL